MSRAVVCLLALLCASALTQPVAEMDVEEPMCEGTAMYRVTNRCQWTGERHPTDYPSDAAFSPLCGAAHNAEYMMFYEDGVATDGVKYVAEMGDCSFLQGEIEECDENGYCDAASYFSTDCTPEGGDQGAGVCTHETTVDVAPGYPYVSMVSMLVPSPDWFVGVSDVNLCVEAEDGAYVWTDRYPAEGYVNLYAWDAGTDAGETFTSDDDPLEPREPIAELDMMDDSNIFYNGDAGMLYPLCQIQMEKM